MALACERGGVVRVVLALHRAVGDVAELVAEVVQRKGLRAQAQQALVVEPHAQRRPVGDEAPGESEGQG